MTFWRSSPGKLLISSFGSGRGAACVDLWIGMDDGPCDAGQMTDAHSGLPKSTKIHCDVLRISHVCIATGKTPKLGHATGEVAPCAQENLHSRNRRRPLRPGRRNRDCHRDQSEDRGACEIRPTLWDERCVQDVRLQRHIHGPSSRHRALQTAVGFTQICGTHYKTGHFSGRPKDDRQAHGQPGSKSCGSSCGSGCTHRRRKRGSGLGKWCGGTSNITPFRGTGHD